MYMREEIARDNDFSRWDEDKTLKYIRTDKNGSRYYECHVCTRCGGTGILPEFRHHDRGTCYKCGGTGWVEGYTVLVRTAEYAKALCDRRVERWHKQRKEQAATHNSEMFARMGLSPQGEAWIVMGDTYDMKDTLKEQGARYNGLLGWHFDHEVQGYDLTHVTPDTVIGQDSDGKDMTLMEHEADTGWISFEGSDEPRIAYINRIQDEYKAKHMCGGYVGEVGERITVQATLTRRIWFEVEKSWGYGTSTMYVYKFTDADGNLFVWKTSAWIDEDEGDAVQLTGTVKEHSEYKHEKQTMLTRCKIGR